MVLRAFGGPLGLLSGAIEKGLGLLLELDIDPEALIGSGSVTSWALFGLLLSLRAASSCFRFFEVVVYFIMNPLRVDCDLPRRPSEPKSLSFTIRKPACSQHLRFGAEDGPQNVWGSLAS